MKKNRLIFSTIALVIIGTLISNAQEKLNPNDTFTRIDNYLSNGTA